MVCKSQMLGNDSIISMIEEIAIGIERCETSLSGVIDEDRKPSHDLAANIGSFFRKMMKAFSI